MFRAACLASLLFALVAVAASAQPEQPEAVATFAVGDSAAVPGVEFFEEIIYLPVRVDGSDPLPFVLDTGAGPISALDSQVAAALGIKGTPMGQSGGAGEDRVDVQWLDPVALSVSGLAFAPRAIAGIPIQRLDPHWGKRKVGLVGGDLLSQLVTVVDYEARRLVFHDPDAYGGGSGERVPVEILDGFLFVRAQVLRYGSDDAVEAFMMVDTGVRTSLFNSPFAAAQDLAGQSPSTITGITGFGIGGVSRGVVGRVRAISLGGITIENPVVTFSSDTTGVLASPAFAGIIGADILSRFRVVIDYGRSCLGLERNRRFGEPVEYDMSGIRFLTEGERLDRFKVYFLFPGSPAAEAGLAEGDEVTAVDGRPARVFTRETLGAYLRRDGASVRFTIQRGNATREIAVQLRRQV